MNEAARIAPAVARNRQPILSILRRRLPETARVLEIASGTGEHAAWFCAALPGLTWQPSDRDPGALASIGAWREAVGLLNFLPPVMLDAGSGDTWPVQQADAVVSINMIHIAPWQATVGMFAGAAGILPAGGLLYLYGPFLEGGVHTAASNHAFDKTLRERDAAWGVRDLGEVAALAAGHGLMLTERIRMPADNLSVVFRQR